MRFAINTPNFGAFWDPRVLATLAEACEASGWDGFFIWDHLLRDSGQPVGDPWLQLTAVALATTRIRIGTMVTALPRRQPWELAREAVTLDHVSGGRLVLGAGLGDDSLREYSAFGDTETDRVHAQMLDEGLAILDGLWSGETFSFEGRHFRVDNAQFLPVPVQRPRIPIWVGGHWPGKAPFRRAARWDGVVPVGQAGPLSPEQCREVRAFVHEHRTSAEPFELAVVDWKAGQGNDASRAAEYASAGVTWYQVSFSPDAVLDDVLARIRMGPPRVG